MSQVERLKDLCARLGTADCLGRVFIRLRSNCLPFFLFALFRTNWGGKGGRSDGEARHHFVSIFPARRSRDM